MSTPFDYPPITRYRPTAVLVIAILHLVGGGLGLLCTPFGLAANSMQTAGNTPEAVMARKMEQAMEMAVPGYSLATRVQLALDLGLDGLLIAGGIGLIFMKRWARTASLVYAWMSILLKIGLALWAFGWMLPGMNAAFGVVLGRDPRTAAMVPFVQALITGSIIINLLFIAYPIVVLAILTRPSIVAAFRGEAPPSSFPEDELDQDRPYLAKPEGIQPPEDRIT